jgi:hypothetical protein
MEQYVMNESWLRIVEAVKPLRSLVDVGFVLYEGNEDCLTVCEAGA